MKSIRLLLVVLVLAGVVNAQIATGGDFALQKSVVAGGGVEASGGAFDIASTAGQTVAGGPKASYPFGIYSGFWASSSVPTPSGPCPLGQGYWKNNPHLWPVDSFVLGNETYTRTELLAVLNTPSGSGKKADASLILAYQLIAAKLNVANGIDPIPLGTAISDGEYLLSLYNGKLPYMVASSTPNGQNMIGIALFLESFNKGLLMPGCSL